MQNSLRRFAKVFMVLTALLVALYSLRFAAVLTGRWPLIDAGIRALVEQVPFRALAHMLIAPIALLSGALQFVPALRARRPLHRTLGKTYVLACWIAGIAALATAPYASGGPVAGVGFGVLAVLWILSTTLAWRMAVHGRIESHRFFMRLSYAMTFGAVTLRLQIPLFIMLGFPGYPAASVWLAYTSWIPNVVAVLVYSALEARRVTARSLPYNGAPALEH
jgi:hypothetical protein